MNAMSRIDNSRFARWWFTVDRLTLGAVCLLVGCGYMMVLAASPSVADHLVGVTRESFMIKQLFFLAVAVAIIVGVSMLPTRRVRGLAIAGCAVALTATFLTLVIGVGAKGATRWLSVAGFRLQPSEFLKPLFAVTTAWLIARQRRTPRFPGIWIAFGLLAAILLILKQQPDVGMIAIVLAVFLTQLFISGIHLMWFAVLLGCASGAAVALYTMLRHVRGRFDMFWNQKANYQIGKVMDAFAGGGWFGRGPGEGIVKETIPDVHADVVFAVVGEEYGLVVCLLLIGVFGFIVLRGLLRLTREQDMFVVLGCTGLVAGFGLQTMVNLFSTLGLMPTKGMTLPFISYGGSSALAVGLGMGMLLALTRARFHDGRLDEDRFYDDRFNQHRRNEPRHNEPRAREPGA